jgi:erythromycin esterase-like protein
VVDQLLDFQHRTAELMQRDGRLAEDEFFFAEQNARLIKNAEEYYRSMFRGRESWNLRDTHMVETLGAPHNFMLLLRDGGIVLDRLRESRLERAIGVIYRPETERWSHYFHARLPDQFDAIIHIDATRAVEPLERTAGWEWGDLPETFPSGK